MRPIKDSEKDKIRDALLALTRQDKYFPRSALPPKINYSMQWGSYITESQAKARRGQYYITPKGYRLIRGEI